DAPPDILRPNRFAQKCRSSLEDFERVQNVRVAIGEELQGSCRRIVAGLCAVGPALLPDAIPKQGARDVPRSGQPNAIVSLPSRQLQAETNKIDRCRCGEAS